MNDGSFRETSDRLDRFFDVVAAGLVTVFTFALPLPESGLEGRAFVFQISSWFVFVLNVGVLWFLQRESSRHRAGRLSNADMFLHIPLLAAMLLMTVPARRIAILQEFAAGPERRGEFLGSLAWYAALLGFGIFSLAWLQLDGAPGESPARRAARRSRLRLHVGAAVLAALTAWLVPRFGGRALLPWFLFPAWYGIERLRLLTAWPELDEAAEVEANRPVEPAPATSTDSDSDSAPGAVADESPVAGTASDRPGEPPTDASVS